MTRIALLGAFGGLVLLAGCGKDNGGLVLQNQRPQVELSAAPLQNSTEYYTIRLNWFASDADGQVTHFLYAVDPPAGGDTVWTTVRRSEVTLQFRSRDPQDPLPPGSDAIESTEYHTFVIKAVDNEDATSPPVYRSFNSRTVAPRTNIRVPVPSNLLPARTTPSVRIEWNGDDPDGAVSQLPVKYKFKLVTGTQIAPDHPGNITPAEIQSYFGQDAGTFFASWDSVPGDTTFKFYEGLTAGTPYYFAVVAFDEAGAYEPRFNRDSNVLFFVPSLNKQGPVITVFNEFFQREQDSGGISLAPQRIYDLEFPANDRIKLNWTARAPQGAFVNGYRWAVDLEDQNILDETPRRDDDDVQHWSSWSVTENSATIGPFAGSLDSIVVHYFYLEARDNLGFISLYTIRLSVVQASFKYDLLLVDDMYGNTDLNREPFTWAGSYPAESEQDTFYCAVGGFNIPPGSGPLPDGNGRAVVGVSQPGVFSAFDFDTLDYKFWPTEGIGFSKLADYKVVAWYSNYSSASRGGTKFSTSPMTALRFMNKINQLNTLAVYLRQGGKGFFFGDGFPNSVANGFITKIVPPISVATFPYTSGEANSDILRVGNFLFDFIHIRSSLNVGDDGSGAFLQGERLQSAIPYLPQFAGDATQEDRTHDPRIGSSAERTAVRWSALPRLTVIPYRGSTTTIVPSTWYVGSPLFVTEGSGASLEAVLDTLYLFQARDLDMSQGVDNSDGKPNALYYHGSEHGEVVWMGFPFYYFELDKARVVANTVLTNLGLQPKAPKIRRGPGAARPWASAIRSDASRFTVTGYKLENRSVREDP